MPEEGFSLVNEGIKTTLPAQEVNLGKRKKSDDQDSLAEVQVVPSRVDEVDLGGFWGNHQAHPHLDGDAAVPQKRARIGARQARPLGLVIDENTMLSRDELLEGQQHFIGNQAILIRELATRQAIVAAKARIERMLSKPIAMADCAPELNEFWNSVGAALRASHAQAGSETREHKRAGTSREAPAQDQPSQIEDTDLGTGPDFGGGDIPEPEVRRRHPNIESAGTPVGLSSGGIGTEVARSGHFGGAMPWSDYLELGMSAGLQSDSSVSGCGSEHNWHDFESAFGQAAGTTRTVGQGPQWESEDETQAGDEALVRHRQHRSRVARSLSRDRINWPRSAEGRTGSQTGSQSGHEQDLSRHGEGHFAEGPSLTQERLAFERETSQFLEYVRAILRDAGGASSFSFSDVFSIHGRRDVSANAFYHILCKLSVRVYLSASFVQSTTLINIFSMSTYHSPFLSGSPAPETGGPVS